MPIAAAGAKGRDFDDGAVSAMRGGYAKDETSMAQRLDIAAMTASAPKAGRAVACKPMFAMMIITTTQNLGAGRTRAS